MPQINIRLSDDDARRFREAAHRKRLSLTTFARSCIMQIIEREGGK